MVLLNDLTRDETVLCVFSFAAVYLGPWLLESCFFFLAERGMATAVVWSVPPAAI